MTHEIVEEIVAARSCCLVDDVHWNAQSERFEGSFLWHGIPTSYSALNAFAELAAGGADAPDVVAGISSSGIAWATAVALRIRRPLAVLRLARHRYGVHNAELPRWRGGRAWLIDNFVGSGETLQQAQGVLREHGIDAVRTLAVEAPEESSVIAAVRTEAKLRELLSRELFSPLGREVAGRYLGGGRRGLDDGQWVRSVQARIADEL